MLIALLALVLILALAGAGFALHVLWWVAVVVFVVWLVGFAVHPGAGTGSWYRW